MRISLANIGTHLILLGRDHVDVGRDGLRDRVIEEEHVLDDWAELVIDVGIQILSMSAHQVEFIVDVDIRVDLLVERKTLDLVDGLTAIVDADIEQLKAHLLELIEILFLGLNKLDAVHGRRRDGDDSCSCRLLTLPILLLIGFILLCSKVWLSVPQVFILLLERRLGVLESADDLVSERFHYLLACY